MNLFETLAFVSAWSAEHAVTEAINLSLHGPAPALLVSVDDFQRVVHPVTGTCTVTHTDEPTRAVTHYDAVVDGLRIHAVKILHRHVVHACSICGRTDLEDGVCPDHPSSMVDSVLVSDDNV